ncbi:MAG TPA: hypothetical protein VHI71_09620 [Actinomycetota bacterium]|nr:hypothetical protein [Actinomycetota bacterium]
MYAKLRLLIGLVAATGALSLGAPAVADCGGPEIVVSPREAAPGDEIVIGGRGWGDACNDTTGPGCDPPPLGEPIQDIALQLKGRGDGVTVDLATVDADDEYLFETTVTVPDVPPGRYFIVDGRREGNFSGPALRITP